MSLILVVDDEEDVRQTVATILSKNGYTVVSAFNADDALKKLKTASPDLILLDIMMPGTPVKDVLPKITNVRICFLTVVRTTEAEKMDLFSQDNVVGFIQKPFDLNVLLSRVKELVKK